MLLQDLNFLSYIICVVFNHFGNHYSMETFINDTAQPGGWKTRVIEQLKIPGQNTICMTEVWDGYFWSNLCDFIYKCFCTKY